MKDGIYQRFYGSRASCDQLVELCRRALNVPGDFVECGVALASGIAVMRYVDGNRTKRVWGYDSFQGIQLAGEKDTEQPGIGAITHDVDGDLLVSSGVTVHPKVQVEEILYNYYGFKEEDFILVEGWVQDTLPKIKPKKIALLRLDMDIYDPTLFALRQLWSRISSGGILLVDDWNLVGVQRACTDFFKEIGYVPHWVANEENPRYLVK